MNSRERRVIHLALRNETAVRSESAGAGPARHVVVYPAGMASLPEPPRGIRFRAAPAPSADVPSGTRRSRSRPAARWTVDRGGRGGDRGRGGPRGGGGRGWPSPVIAAQRHHRRHFHAARPRRPRHRAPFRPRCARDRGARPAFRSTSGLARLARRIWPNCPTRDGHAVDQVVVTFFARPRSYTAEDVVEIACHGSPVVLRHARGARARRRARGWPSPASSRCAPSSTAASTCRRPKRCAT